MVQQAADKATYERRAMAVERERAIAENELQNQIELARREEQLVDQRGQNERRRATEAAAAGQIETAAAAGSAAGAGEAEADAKRVIGAAEADAEKALLDAYAELDQADDPRAGDQGGRPAGDRHAEPDPGPDHPLPLTASSASAAARLTAMSLAPRAVVVHRATELDRAGRPARHPAAGRRSSCQPRPRPGRGRGPAPGPAGGAGDGVGRDPAGLAARPVERNDLDRFVFGPEDVVVAVGQDGLVANVAKYLDGQPVIGINPEPAATPASSCRTSRPRSPTCCVIAGTRRPSATMVAASTDDGQRCSR